MRRLLVVTVLLVACIFSIAWAFPQDRATAWEYKFEYEIREKKANELGAQGWQLVSASPTGGGSSVTEYIFKRPR